MPPDECVPHASSLHMLMSQYLGHWEEDRNVLSRSDVARYQYWEQEGKLMKSSLVNNLVHVKLELHSPIFSSSRSLRRKYLGQWEMTRISQLQPCSIEKAVRKSPTYFKSKFQIHSATRPSVSHQTVAGWIYQARLHRTLKTKP